MTKKRPTPELPPGFRNDPLLQLHWAVQENLDVVYSWLTDPLAFRGLQLKVRDDGSVIAVAKGVSGDGTPVVAFGSGYDALSALSGLEGALHANNWRPDKPWAPKGNGNGSG